MQDRNQNEISNRNPLPWKVLIVDDDLSVHEITKIVARKIHFENRTITFLNAYSKEEAQQILLKEEDVALILLDVIMGEDDSGLQLVKWIRDDIKNNKIRIILRTGHSGLAPESEIIHRYEINDYKEKTEMSYTKLNTSIVTALRNYRDIVYLEKLNRDLRIANEEIACTSMGKTQFLKRLSHELRTPLNGIAVTSQLLKMTPLDLEQMQYVDLLEKSAERMLPFLDQMLEITQLESDEYKLVNVWFSIQNLMKSLEAKYQPLAQEKQLNCYFEMKSDIPAELYGDPLRLEQVLSHLLDNSLKFTDEGFIGLEVRKNNEALRTVSLEFSITDTGRGIAKEDRQNIFTPYYSAHEDELCYPSGLGLGLSIVQKTIQLMNGHIWMDHNYSKGVQFVFALEFKKEKL